jgi:hypothetical protein
MKSVRFSLRANSHDPSVSVTNEMPSATYHTGNDMGKIVRSKHCKTLSEGELARNLVVVVRETRHLWIL